MKRTPGLWRWLWSDRPLAAICLSVSLLCLQSVGIALWYWVLFR